MLQALAAESILQGRELQWTSPAVSLILLAAIALAMMLLWRRLSAGKRVCILTFIAITVETSAYLLQAAFPVILDTAMLHIAIMAYMAAIALEEIDVRGLLGRIGENRFQRIAMSLSDGLVCTDSNYLITVWNPGAAAIFGYEPGEVVGRPFDTIVSGGAGRISISRASALGAGDAIEFEGRRRNGEVFPAEVSFSAWEGTDGWQYRAILRDISVRKREADKIRYLAEHDALTGLNRHTLDARLATMIDVADSVGCEVGLLVIGLDGFQQINDLLGHSNGDLVLRGVADRLACQTASSGVIARLSGDEFAIALPIATDSVDDIASHVLAGFNAPVRAGNRLHRIKASIGRCGLSSQR